MDTAYRVLVFGMEFPPSATGSATYAARLAAGLSGRGVEVRVLAPATADDDGASFDASQPFEIVRLPYLGFPLRRYLVARRWLRDTLTGFQPDLLWVTNGMACRVAGLVRLPERTALVSSIRGSDIMQRLPGSGIWRRLESLPQRRCYRESQAIAAASEFLKSVAARKGVDGDKIFVSPSAVDIEKLESVAANTAPEYSFLEGKSVILTVARLVAQKRIDLTVRAFARVVGEFPRSCLALVGDGPERRSIEREIRRLGLDSRIYLLGTLRPMSPALLKLYRRADLFVMLGVEEGMPNVFMEAGAFRLPSVGADSGGTPEVVRHGETGLLAAADDENDTAEKLMRLLADDHLRQRMGDSARGWIGERFSMDVLSHSSFEIVKRVLERRDPRTRG